MNTESALKYFNIELWIASPPLHQGKVRFYFSNELSGSSFTSIMIFNSNMDEQTFVMGFKVMDRCIQAISL